MSGRKSSEVSALLSRAVKAREAGNANFKNNFDRAVELLESCEKRTKEICKDMSSMKVMLNQDSYAEFKAECEMLENQFKSLQMAVEQRSYAILIDDYKNIRQTLDKKLQEADKENNRISNIIKQKSWYLDQEYADADKLVGVYNNISNEKNKLISNINNEVKNGTIYANYCENKESQLQALANSMKDLNQKASEIVKCRKQASEARNHLQDEFNNIDKNIAIKFMKDEYAKL